MGDKFIGKQDRKLIGESADGIEEEVARLSLPALQNVVAGARTSLVRTRAINVLRLRAAFAVASMNEELSAQAMVRISRLDYLIDRLELNIDRALADTVRGKRLPQAIARAQRKGQLPKPKGNCLPMVVRC